LATDIAVKRPTEICCELFWRSVWTDKQTVAILALAVTSKNATFMCKAICFFLNVEEKMAMDQKRAKELMQSTQLHHRTMYGGSNGCWNKQSESNLCEGAVSVVQG
jgi:hypothetical protein